jgi:hypothetical protein
MSAGIIHTFEDLLPAELQQQVWEACSTKRWYFGNSSTGADAPGFWKMDLDGDATITRLWEAAKAPSEALAGHPLQVLRQYANGHTYGLGGQIHVDDPRDGHYTLIYYPMLEWKAPWGGETIFLQPSGDIAFSLMPKPNRAVFFDGRIAHAGRAPNRSFNGLRVTIAFKLAPLGSNA